jgi:site-specific recombinase XerD
MISPGAKPNFGLTIVIRKSRPHNGDEFPIFYRITLNGQSCEIATKLYVRLEDWDAERKKVKGKSSKTKQTNEAIEDFQVHIRSTYNKLLTTEHNIITLAKLKDAINGIDVRRSNFLDLYAKHMEAQKKRVGFGYALNSYSVNISTFNHVVKYVNTVLDKQDLYVNELDFNFIEGLHNYLIQTQKQRQNTAGRIVQRVKAIINILIKRGIMDKDPFAEIKTQRQKGQITYLTLEELDIIEAKSFGIDRLDQVKNIFVFGCYTGLAYADMYDLKSEDIKLGSDGRKWILKQRKKTGVQSDIPLLPPALSILENYSKDLSCIYHKKLLPVIINQKMNAYLKEIADVCNIKKKISMHVARHTFATTVCLCNGVSLESVSKMLGHTNVRMTQVYAKVLNSKVASDTNHLHALFMEKGKGMLLTPAPEPQKNLNVAIAV